MMRAYLAGAMLAAVLIGCGTGHHQESRLEPPAAAALADSLRAALTERFKPPVEVRYGKFANPANGDSIPGYVVWEDLHEPVDVADWYSMTLGVPTRASRRSKSAP